MTKLGFEYNEQFINGVTWLKAMRVFKNDSSIAAALKLPRSTFSFYMTNRQGVPKQLWNRFYDDYLKPAMEKDQGGKASKIDFKKPKAPPIMPITGNDLADEIIRMLTTKISVLEVNIESVSEKLDMVLEKLNKTKTTKK